MPAKYTTRFFAPILSVWLLCSCTSFPVSKENAGSDQILDLEITKLVLTKRVVLEPEEGERRRFVSQEIVAVTPTSNFGKANEIASLDCVVAGLQELLLSIDIVTPAEFWGAMGDNVETIKVEEIFNEPYSRAMNKLDIDYLIIAFHQLIDRYNGYGEYVALGAADDINLEVSSAVTVDMHTERIIDATEFAGVHRSSFMHYLFIPVYLHGSPEEDPCAMTGRHAAAVISQTHDRNATPRIAVVAALTNPYTKVTGIEHDYVPIGAKQNSASSSEMGCITSASSGGANNMDGIITKATVYCPSADRGHAISQSCIGDLYYLGAYDLQKDLVQAYVWYSLAATSDYPTAAEKVAELQTEMSDELLVEARQEVEQWQPGSCRQDLLEAAAGSPE